MRSNVSTLVAGLLCTSLGCMAGGREPEGATSPRAEQEPSSSPAASVEPAANRLAGGPRREASAPAPAPALPASWQLADRTRTTFAGSGKEQDTLLAELRAASPTRFKPVGSTSTVFRASWDGPFDMAFKSQTRERPRGPIAEVAAYRVARCLGMDSVPPATLRKLPIARLREGLAPEDRQQWSQIEQRLVADAEGMVLGAAIYWVPALHDVGIDTGTGIRQWSEWLTLGGQIPATARTMMAYLSTMLLFDYLIANWDRFSGGNAKGDAQASLLYLRDHDSAFAPAIQATVQRRVLERMLRAERFSRSFYRTLRALTPAELDACLAAEGLADPLLSSAQLDAFFDRRATVLSHVSSLIELHGADRVLVFP